MTKIETNKMPEFRLALLKERGLTFDSVYMDGKLEDLKTKLLEIGGEAVQLGIKGLVSKSQEFLGKGKLFLPKNFTHQTADPQTFDGKLYSGFVLDDSGFWRFHSYWAYNETSNVLADDCSLGLAYYGLENFWE